MKILKWIKFKLAVIRYRKMVIKDFNSDFMKKLGVLK